MQILKSQIKEWLENPVAEIYRKSLAAELEEVNTNRGAFFLKNDAVQTHTVRSNLIGQELILADMIALLNGEQEQLEQYLIANGINIVEDVNGE